MNKIFLLLLLFPFFFTSCFVDDDEIIEPTIISYTVGKVELTTNYKYQVFYSLATDSSVSYNLITDWDLGFECSDSGWHVKLNQAKTMYAGNSNSTDFSSVTSSSAYDMYFDPSYMFAADSTAIGEWYNIVDESPVSKNFVYVINRGTDADGNSVGYKKIQLDFQNGNYQITSANLDGSNEVTDIIEKNEDVNFVCYSLTDGIVDIEPAKDDWDIVFTKYATMLSYNDAPYAYTVTGVLLNPYNRYADSLPDIGFDEITSSTVEDLELGNQKDIIGYSWKSYNMTSGRYTVDSDKIFILKDNDDNYYKIRFIDFYDSDGNKGYPSFEYLNL